MATSANPTRDDFEALLNEQLGGAGDEGFEGRVVKGTVTAIENGMAVIDVGLKSEGRISLKEFMRGDDEHGLEVGGDLRQVAADEHPAGEPRFEEHHAEAFGDTRRDDRVGRGEGVGERHVVFAADVEPAVDPQLVGELLPPIERRPFRRVGRRQRHRVAGAPAGERRVQQHLADVLPADATNRVDDEARFGGEAERW